MEQFKVEPQFLKGYSEQIGRNADFVGQTRAYLASEGNKTDKMSGLLSPIVDGYRKVLAWQLDLLDSMNRKLADSATALDKPFAQSQRDYRTADRQQQHNDAKESRHVRMDGDSNCTKYNRQDDDSDTHRAPRLGDEVNEIHLVNPRLLRQSGG
jgi:hypothetical protein